MALYLLLIRKIYTDFNHVFGIISLNTVIRNDLILFQAIQRLGNTCGLINLRDSVEELRTKPFDSFTPKMRNLRGTKIQLRTVNVLIKALNAKQKSDSFTFQMLQYL